MKKSKKMLCIMLAVMLLITMIPYQVEASSKLKLNKTKATIYVGKSCILQVDTTKKVKWSSSNKKVATVNAKGKVKAKKQGTATITAKIGNKKLKCKVTVKKFPKPTQGNKYTPEQAVAVYCSLLENGGVVWSPSLKKGGSWGTGWIYLEKGMPEWAASSSLKSFAKGDRAGNPWTHYYIEITGSDEDVVYVKLWGD